MDNLTQSIKSNYNLGFKYISKLYMALSLYENKNLNFIDYPALSCLFMSIRYRK